MEIKAKGLLSPYLRMLRINQWAKNILLFLPLLAAHQISDGVALEKLAIAFIAFSLCASSVYIINDLVDIENDRRHPIKRRRPFASGEVSSRIGVAIVPLLLISSGLLSFLVGIEFLAIVLVYFLITCTYSLWLKRVMPIDCMTLAILYTLRVVAGAVAVQVPLSFWLLSFSFFIFLSLANLKRYAELQLQNSHGNSGIDGRGYRYSDSHLVKMIGICSGFTSSLILALYLQGETVTILYSQPEFIWMSIPLLLLWINWLWVKADRGQLQVDPLDYALRDRVSFFVGFLILICFLLATSGVSF